MSEAATRRGLLAALSAFTLWGLAPAYWKLLVGVPAGETVAHRVCWSLLVLAVPLALSQGFGILSRLVREPRLALILATTTALTAVNWLLFVWAVLNGHVLESSLGYFIAPLCNVLLGRLFLGEKLRPWQAAAVALAVAGVLWRVWHLGALPWIPLSLAITFSLYGLLRKRAPVGALDGLFVETLMGAPFALAWLIWISLQGQGHFGPDLGLLAALIGTGVVTAVPFLLYAVGAKRLRYTTLGFAQYIGPTLQFLLAVFVYHEPFNHVALVGFACIWAGLAVFSLDAVRHASRQSSEKA